MDIWGGEGVEPKVTMLLRYSIGIRERIKDNERYMTGIIVKVLELAITVILMSGIDRI